MGLNTGLGEYKSALKEGRRTVRKMTALGLSPYPLVLEEELPDAASSPSVALGELEVPIEQICGTKSASRQNAFSSDFMPLLEPETEFAMKWATLFEALGKEGLRDSITCYEYLGKLYVAEGNKRLSVMRWNRSVTIPARVTRLMGTAPDEATAQAYEEFLRIFGITGLYQVRFTHPELFDALQGALGLEADHVWTDEERKGFLAGYYRFKRAYRRRAKDRGLVWDMTPCDALVVWLGSFSFDDLKGISHDDLKRAVKKAWDDLELAAGEPLREGTISDVTWDVKALARPGISEFVRGLFRFAAKGGTKIVSTVKDAVR